VFCALLLHMILNSLPDHCRRENGFSQFRSLIQSWDGSRCHCSTCIVFSISFWFILMFFHLIILNIILLFIATDLLLVIVNSCLERHLPRGLLFVIANSTSILHACIEWFLVYDLNSDISSHPRIESSFWTGRSRFPSCNDPEGYSKSYIKAEHKTQKYINKIEAH
jgi:hypothetical protein